MPALRLPLRSRQAALLVALMVALWVAGTLGLVHRSVHVPGVPHAVAMQPGSSVDHDHEHSKGNWVLTLFGQHHEDADCRLYDQLAHGPAALGVPMMVLPLVLPVAVFDYLEGQALARWVALFDARGPPSSR